MDGPSRSPSNPSGRTAGKDPMIKHAYRYRFDESVEMADALGGLLVSAVAAEGLLGRPLTRSDAGYAVDKDRSVVLVDADTAAGVVINAIFSAILRRAFAGAFCVRRVELVAATLQQESQQ